MSVELQNDCLIRALLRQPVDYTPVWLMRQAGRYLPEYRALRKQAGDFLSLCKNPELASQITLQPVERYPLDAAIIFSDILTVPDAMGLGLSVEENTGPRFARVVRDAKAVDALPIPDVSTDLDYVLEAIRLTQERLGGKIPLIGFSGSPWTLATYMVEGQGSKEFHHIRAMVYQNTELLHQLLEKLTIAIVHYLNAQIAAGVQVVMLFDTWGGILTGRGYEEFSLTYIRRILSEVQRQYDGARIPTIVFTKGAGLWTQAIANCGCDAMGVDWTQDIATVRKQTGERVALQGNLDPAALYGDEKRIRQEVQHILAAYGEGSGHVFNLGHGVQRYVTPESVAICVAAVHELSRPYHHNNNLSDTARQ